MLKIRLNLKKVSAITICIAFSVTVFAQDIIILKNGNDIQAIVLEVGTDDVKYKKFDNQNGPNYTLKKSDIFMIRYENGSKDVFNEIVTPAPAEVQQQTTVNRQAGFYNGNADSQQPIPTLKYTFGKQISPYGSEKSPFLAGFLSFLIPGLGQFYNGDMSAGFLYLGANIVCNSVWMSSISTDYYGNAYIDETKFTIGFIGALVINISSIVNGAQMAKRVNIARGYCLGDNTYLKIQPTIIQQNNLLTTSKEYACGMNFSLNF
jgi:TM2 domain-containing membrane protein YozV